MPLIRLDKFIADAVPTTRSRARELIKLRSVCVNGRPVRLPEAKIDPERDEVLLSGERLSGGGYVYLMMNKPKGVVCATSDSAEKTVLDLLDPALRTRGVFPIGRLDKDTTGLLLLTNDGAFAHEIISPAKHISKRYLAKTEGTPTPEDILAFGTGVVLRDGTVCRPALLEVLGENFCAVTVCEGKYHQVKRMLASRGKPVLELERVAIGGLVLDKNLAKSTYRKIMEVEKQSILDKN